MARLITIIKNLYFRSEDIFTVLILFFSVCSYYFDLYYFSNLKEVDTSCRISIESYIIGFISIILILLLFVNKVNIKKKISCKPVTNSYIWRILFSLFLAIFSLIISIINDDKYANDIISDFYRVVPTIISLLSFALLFIYTFKSNLPRIINKKLQKRPYNIIRIIATDQEYFILAIFIGIATLITLTILMRNFPFNQVGTSILDISFTIIGGFFSVLIYFKIEEKTTSLSDYMNKFIKILQNSYPNDEIYIIGPTLFIGQEFNSRLHDNFKKALFEKIGIVKFTIANLHYKNDLLNNIFDAQKLDTWQKDVIRYRNHNFSNNEKVNNLYKMKRDGAIKKLLEFEKNISDKNNGLMCFHKVFVPIDKKFNSLVLEPNFDHHCKLISFYSEIVQRDYKASTNKINFRTLNWLYYSKPEYTNKKINDPDSPIKESEVTKFLYDTALKKTSNFFAVANTTRGDYYIGQFKVTNNKVHEFHGTSFKNENIENQMKIMLNSFIDEYPCAN